MWLRVVCHWSPCAPRCLCALHHGLADHVSAWPLSAGESLEAPCLPLSILGVQGACRLGPLAEQCFWGTVLSP